MNYLYIWWVQLKLTASLELAYRNNFILRLVSLALFDILAPIFALVIYSVSLGIPGWEFSEFLLFVGTFTFVFGLESFLFSQLPWITSFEVQEGRFDRTLLRPGKTLLYLLTHGTNLEAISSIFVGFVIIVFAITRLGISLAFVNVLAYVTLILFALLFLLSLSIFASALSFIVVKSYAIIYLFHHIREGGRYPITIFGATGVFFLTFILPFGLAAFYPASALLGRLNLLTVLNVTAASLVFFFFSIIAWVIGIKKYSSAGG